jgi:hypothetical protein
LSLWLLVWNWVDASLVNAVDALPSIPAGSIENGYRFRMFRNVIGARDLETDILALNLSDISLMQ